ncbi:MAG: DUF3604 domain-containing protein [archaeon]|nr:DUF3604 domain-containing protein [archaeon]
MNKLPEHKFKLGLRKRKNKKKPQKNGKRNKEIKRKLDVILIIATLLSWIPANVDFATVVDNNPVLLWVHVPTTGVSGESFSIMIQAWDIYERLSSSYTGTIDFEIESYNLTSFEEIIDPNVIFPQSHTFTGQPYSQGLIPAYLLNDGNDNGNYNTTLTISTPGIHYIKVNDTFTGETYYSNPIIIHETGYTGPDIAWGDVHTHSLLSDGSGTPDELYDYARYVAGLEFSSVTDHGEQMNFFGLGFGLATTFPVLMDSTSRKHEENKFVTFHGAEWTTHGYHAMYFDYGHYTCIFNGEGLPIITADIQQTPDALWALLDEYTENTGEKVFAIPHHTTSNQFLQDWTWVNSKYVRLGEVKSIHGACLLDQSNESNYIGAHATPPETVHGSSINDAYKLGLKFGIMANGDGHDGHPGHSLTSSRATLGIQYPFTYMAARTNKRYPGGITAVRTNSLSRNDIFNSLQSGKVYASSDHGRPFVNFSVNGISPGEEINSTISVSNPTDPRIIDLTIALDGAPSSGFKKAASISTNWKPNWNATIDIFKNGNIWNTTILEGPLIKINYTDTEAITGTKYDYWIDSEEESGKYLINSASQKPVDKDDFNSLGEDFYYVRVTTGLELDSADEVENIGRTLWCGPIWVKIS